MAALVLSKVYFHMEKWDDSIRLALLAGPLFDIQDQSEYNRTILTKAIDLYVATRAHNYCHPDRPKPIDPGLEKIVEEMIKRCLEANDLHQVAQKTITGLFMLVAW